MKLARSLPVFVYSGGNQFMHIRQELQAPRSAIHRRWAWALPLALGLSLVAAPSLSQTLHTPSLGTSASTLPAQSSTIAQMETEVLQRINQKRQRQGLPALQLNPRLSLVARSHSQQMAQYNFYSHIDPQGRNHRRRVEALGLRAYLIGENLMKCIRSSDPVGLSVESWMRSPGHRKNILLPEMQETGVGIWRKGQTYYVTQIYMEPK
ncbi:CAP domain-containing protein [Acaryochloris marina]|uniref:SCP domain-containing protein n=2 Tax=Acaryochloris marina TaxID=155978 RepID=B0BZ25_ACAM1|nr:CAP domain-containing protein [Acaryochloris marina]ABW28325.1 conserved hypothetical protein [Acaryochloris marina MBIC11017]